MSRVWAVPGLMFLACVGWASAETFHVSADGTGEYPTIQAAVNAAVDGDVILLGDGTFSGDGNWDVEIIDKDVTIGSESGDPTRVVIDCEDGSEQHRAFVLVGGYPIVHGISMIHGTAGSGSSCGGAMNLGGSGATIANCIFAENTAFMGGAVVASWGELTITSCTFYGNEATSPQEGGAALAIDDFGSAHLNNCIAAFGEGGGAIGSLGGSVELFCCDIFGNTGGDYVGPIADQFSVNDNISVDPLFCDAANLDLRLSSDSPCAPGGDCGLVGALPIGCGPTPVETGTWGAIKALYRSE